MPCFRLSTLNSELSTATRTCLRQPVMRYRRKKFASANSVALFPRERMRDITNERFALEKMSGIFAGNLVNQFCRSKCPGRNADIPGIHPLVPRTNFYKIIPGQLMDGFQRPIFGKSHDKDILEQLFVLIIAVGINGSGFLRVTGGLD